MTMKAVPEGALQSVLSVGQQAKVWGDQLEAGKAQQAVQVQEGHAAPPREAPQLPAEPRDVHHRLHLQHTQHAASDRPSILHGFVRSSLLRCWHLMNRIIHISGHLLVVDLVCKMHYIAAVTCDSGLCDSSTSLLT